LKELVILLMDMESKKQTAVEWLVDILELSNPSKQYQAEIQQAKEMEKQQIIDAYWDGGQDIPLTEKRCEQYYNETFKQ